MNETIPGLKVELVYLPSDTYCLRINDRESALARYEDRLVADFKDKGMFLAQTPFWGEEAVWKISLLERVSFIIPVESLNHSKHA